MLSALYAYFGQAALARAEDLVQDTFVSTLQAWQQNGLPDDPRKWLFRVCKN